MSVEQAVLRCSSCGQEAEHELRYAGRLVAATRCAACGHVVRHEQRDLAATYLRDLEHRLTTKPARLLRQASTDPARFLSSLPASLARQPVKLAQELWTLVRL